MTQTSYAVCLNNQGHAASLEPRKLYEILDDSDGEALGMLRVVDESGEAYLYPADRFALLKLPADVEAVLKST